MQFVESISLAISAIKANKMRAFLTMLGIIIGISSVITISAIGASAKGMVEDTIKGTGLEYIYIMPNWEMTGNYVSESDLIHADAAEKLKERMGDSLVYYSPYVYLYGEARYGRQTADLSILGVAPEFTQCTTEINITRGRFISEADLKRSRDVIVIPDTAAETLFGNADPIGKVLQLTMEGELEEFTVVGVFTRKASKLETLLGGGNRYQCYIPYSYLGLDFTSSYLETYVDTDTPEETAQSMCTFLEKVNKKDPGFYTYSAQSTELGEFNNIMDILSLAIGAIAAISLLVGGIGIMNIMLVSVTERTREIGIRKALGARTGDILWQFLIESMILSLIGGILGIGIGIGVAGLAALFMEARLVLEARTVIIAVIFSAMVGIIFGIFPARKAAAKDPIEALRYE